MIDSEIEGNILIAKFMGFENVKKENEEVFCQVEPPNGWEKQFPRGVIKKIVFHKSWNELMPVVEKIEKLGYGFTVDPWGIEIIEYISGKEELVCSFINDDDYPKIEQYFYIIVDFIEFYNKKNG